MSTKVIFKRAEVFVLAEVCLPRGPHAVLPRSQVLSEKRKWRRTWQADEYLYSSCLWPACGRLGRQISARTKTSARLREARLSLPGLYR